MEGKKQRKKDRKKDEGRQRERRGSLGIKAGMYKEVETEIEAG